MNKQIPGWNRQILIFNRVLSQSGFEKNEFEIFLTNWKLVQTSIVEATLSHSAAERADTKSLIFKHGDDENDEDDADGEDDDDDDDDDDDLFAIWGEVFSFWNQQRALSDLVQSDNDAYDHHEVWLGEKFGKSWKLNCFPNWDCISHKPRSLFDFLKLFYRQLCANDYQENIFVTIF